MKKSQRDETERKKFRPLCSKEHALRVWMTQYSYFFDRSNSNPNEAEEIENILLIPTTTRTFFTSSTTFSIAKTKRNESKDRTATKFIVKFHNGVDSVEPNARLLDCHEFAMDWLSEKNICTSAVMLTKSGATRFDWTDGDSTNNDSNSDNINNSAEQNQMKHAVKVLRYVEGTLLIDVVNALAEKPEEQKAFWRRVGEFVGEISASFLQWNPETPSIGEDGKRLYRTLATRESLWDVRNFEDVRMFVDAKSKGEGLIGTKTPSSKFSSGTKNASIAFETMRTNCE